MNRRSFLGSSLVASVLCVQPRLALSITAPATYDLEAHVGKGRLYGEDGGVSDLWLYNKTLPGPELRVRRGETLRVNFTNRLDTPTSIHWHGIRIDNRMDGVAGLTQEPVQPGESFIYEFTVPDAGTFWYHAHTMSWNQVPRGLAGALIVEEDVPAFPREQDLTLFLSDWRLDDGGRLDTASFGAMHDFSHAGRLGNWLTVNGKSMPDIPLVQGVWHRLRVINGSAARVLDLDPSRFGAQVIALDGQALESVPETSGALQLSPGQRVDLALKPEALGAMPFEMTTGQPFAFARFIVTEGPTSSGPRNRPLVAANALPKPDLSKVRRMPLDMAGGAMGGMRALMEAGKDPRAMMQNGQFWAFNGEPGSMEREPLFRAKQGESIQLDIANDTAFTHAIHLHGHHFQVLSLNGEAQDPQDWRDTVTLHRKDTASVAFQADNPGKWLLHCHMLGHAVSGMTTWFEVG
ncbi:multicopper oxidase family protein [Roseibium sp. CAU 1637]|uniref:Multicopper oxidase family protein n=1 Tax=Roseibium limicola TaxID=2816037 RepID=A0A939J516_9HYPH|nr:multicopper oxidase family protein [Roseibium limicola]MBO0345335.1 multicopper oxidase family protein [Roseibium limicola]